MSEEGQHLRAPSFDKDRSPDRDETVDRDRSPLRSESPLSVLEVITSELENNKKALRDALQEETERSLNVELERVRREIQRNVDNKVQQLRERRVEKTRSMAVTGR